MAVAADAVIRFAERHAELAEQLAAAETRPASARPSWRRSPRSAAAFRRTRRATFWEALQAYWFIHLGVITELNTWDSFCPGHLDQHLYPFYQRGTRRRHADPRAGAGAAAVLLGQVQQPARAAQGRRDRGRERHLHRFLQHQHRRPEARRLVGRQRRHVPDPRRHRRDAPPAAIVEPAAEQEEPRPVSQARPGDRPQGLGPAVDFQRRHGGGGAAAAGQVDRGRARGGTSGCVETGAFGKEAYILTGYFNLPKVLEITLNNGLDPRTGKQIGIETGDPRAFATLRRVVRRLPRGNCGISSTSRSAATTSSSGCTRATCRRRSSRCWWTTASRTAGTTTTAARATTPPTSWGSRRAPATDSLAAIRYHVFDRKAFRWRSCWRRCGANFDGHEKTRLMLWNKTPKYGNDDDYADAILDAGLRRVLRGDQRAAEHQGRHLPRELSFHHLPRLFRVGDRRDAGRPQSVGAALRRHFPGAGRRPARPDGGHQVGRHDGPRPHRRHAAEPEVHAASARRRRGLDQLAHLVRSYFKLDGHHIQFNVVTAETLREAQAHPEKHRDLIVRVAGYSDYFCDLTEGAAERDHRADGAGGLLDPA